MHIPLSPVLRWGCNNSSINVDTTTSFSNTHAVQANFNPVKISLTYLGASPLLSPRTTPDALSFLVMYHSKLLPHSYFFTALRQHFPIITYCCLSMYQQLQRHTIVKSTLGTNPQTHPRKGTMKCGTNSQMQLNHQWVNTFFRTLVTHNEEGKNNVQSHFRALWNKTDYVPEKFSLAGDNSTAKCLFVGIQRNYVKSKTSARKSKRTYQTMLQSWRAVASYRIERILIDRQCEARNGI